MSQEHIWPAALGGRHTPAEFKTADVCRPCNSIVGQFVDATFIKTFFVAAERLNGAHEYLDSERPGAAPLLYFGFDTSFSSSDDEVCERWAGPAGELIFHIHMRDDPRWDTIAGGDFLRRRRDDPGRIYMCLTSPSIYWSLTALVSVSQYFDAASKRCLTTCDGLPERFLGFLFPGDEALSKKEQHEVDWIRARRRPTSGHTQMTMQVDFADRFLAKLAVGFAHTFLGEGASGSGTYSDVLRSQLWSRTIADRENIPVQGSGFFDRALEPLRRLLHWPGVWSFYFGQMQNFFGMALFTPTGRSLSMLLSDDPSCWRSDLPRIIREGAVYLVVPQRRHTFGPIPIIDCVAHRNGNALHADLVRLEEWRTGIGSLPPKLIGP